LEEIEAKSDMIMQLQQQLQNMSEIIKQQEGEIQRLKNMLFTADRRSVKAEFEAQLEKKYQRAARDIDVAKEQLKPNKIEGESNGETK
jgi:GTP cyclohydrolase II